jgi:carbon storage regulator CsrA
MLILSRKVNQVILIGDSIRITVVDIGQERVRIGIDAPDDVAIARLEIVGTQANGHISEHVQRRASSLRQLQQKSIDAGIAVLKASGGTITVDIPANIGKGDDNANTGKPSQG